MSAIQKLPITIIGGYLGAGKTTLVNHLLRHADGIRIAVLVNEFGALPIDRDLIVAQDDDIIAIAGGCVCCSYGNDMVQAMLDLTKLDPLPDHVLLEASGVAIPSAIAASLSLLQGYQMDGIVILADVETIQEKAKDVYVGDTVEQQLSDADIVLLNKGDLIHPDKLSDVTDWLGTKNHQAQIVSTQFCQVPRDVVLQAFPTTERTENTALSNHASGLVTQYMKTETTVKAENVAAQLAAARMSLLRAKGFVNTADGLKTIQTVGRRWAVSDAPDGAEPGIVVIACAADLDIAAVKQILN